MMNSLFKLMVFFLLISLFTGCIATHIGNMSGSASLSAPNFVYKKQDITGESKATYVLGIGGTAKSSLILEAKQDMLKNNPLLSNQALANLSVSYKSTMILGVLVTTVKCIVSADIVEFGATNLSPEVGVTEEIEVIEDNTPVEVGDRVNIIKYFNNPVEGKVIEIKNGDYIVEYMKNNRLRRIKVLSFQVEKIRL